MIFFYLLRRRLNRNVILTTAIISRRLKLVSCPGNLLQNISDDSLGMSFRHSRAGGNPVFISLDSRLRGSDLHFVIYLKDITLAAI